MFFVQAVAVSAGIAALLYLVWSYGDLNAALPSVAAFAYGAYRLMPSLQSLMTEASVVRYTKPALDRFYRDYQEAACARREDIDAATQPVAEVDTIEVKALDFRYEGRERPALSGIDLRVARGERIGIVGSSGSGKSTLVDLMVGLLTPTAGQVLIDGVPLGERSVLGVGSAPWVTFRRRSSCPTTRSAPTLPSACPTTRSIRPRSRMRQERRACISS